MPVVYAENILLDNFAINLLILFLARSVLARHARWGRLILSAAIGAIYALLELYPALELLNAWICKGLLSLVMVRVAFPWKRWRLFMRMVFAFWGLSFLLGGAVFALLFLLSQGQYTGQIFTIHSVPIGALLLAIGLGCMSIRFAWLWKTKQAGKVYADVAIIYGGRRVVIHGLVDSGNELQEPLSGEPVIIVAWKVLEELFDLTVRETFARHGPMAAFDLLQESPIVMRMRVIPYATIGQDSVMLAFRAEQVLLLPDEQPVSCYIALTEPGLIHTEQQADALLPSCWHQIVIEGEKQHAYQQDIAPGKPMDRKNTGTKGRLLHRWRKGIARAIDIRRGSEAH